MLCPNCGTEVGDRLTLCPSCAARAGGTEQSGASIGAIRPNVKVVRLTPEEVEAREQQFASVQPEPRMPREQPLDQHSDLASRGDRALHGTPPPSASQRHAPAVTKPPRNQPEFARVAGFFLILAAAWALVVLIRGSWSAPLDFRPSVEEAPPSFSHIVIHEKKKVVVDGSTVIGLFQIEDLQVPLARSAAIWSTGKNSLEVQFFPPPGEIESETETKVKLNPDEPIVKVFLQFAPLKGRLEREKLQSYMIEYLGEKEPVRIVKSFSVHLSAFGEVSPLSGTLKEGEKVRGALRDSRSEEREGKVLHLNWELSFDAPVRITR